MSHLLKVSPIKRLITMPSVFLHKCIKTELEEFQQCFLIWTVLEFAKPDLLRIVFNFVVKLKMPCYHVITLKFIAWNTL